MILRIATIVIFATLSAPSYGDDEAKAKPLQMNVAEVYDFSVSLMELRERTQHKRFEADKLKIIADAFRSAKFIKRIEDKDVARTPYISRYQFQHGFLGGTPRSGETESGMLTIDCRILYLKDGIFSLNESDAEKLLKLFPKPKNILTKSELPEISL